MGDPSSNPAQEDGLTARIRAYDRALNATDVAALLHVSRASVHRLTSARAIPHFRIGKLVRFSPAALIRWVDEKQRPALTPASMVPIIHKRMAREQVRKDLMAWAHYVPSDLKDQYGLWCLLKGIAREADQEAEDDEQDEMETE